MTTALCASPAARMRRGRDERRAEGAVTCGRAARACGAEHTFLPLLFCFLAARAGRHPQRDTHSHTLPPCFYLFIYLVDGSVPLPPCGDGGRRAVPDVLPTDHSAPSVSSLRNGCLLHSVMSDVFFSFVCFFLPTCGAGSAAVRLTDCTERGLEENA
ncbi:ATPase [Trypanosoma cruzi]|nr:ATPase [Trypanosoma cruzi]